MSKKLNKKQIERFSRQIILKNIGILGQNKITNSKVLIIGVGGLGCPVAEFLTRSGIGSLGIVDHDRISLSNIHRQSLFNEKDLNQQKVKIAKKKLNNINSLTKIKSLTSSGFLICIFLLFIIDKIILGINRFRFSNGPYVLKILNVTIGKFFCW